MTGRSWQSFRRRSRWKASGGGRKGHRYGTVLVDLQRSAVVDLLPDRHADTLGRWLRQHPRFEVVARSRRHLCRRYQARGAHGLRAVIIHHHCTTAQRKYIYSVHVRTRTSAGESTLISAAFRRCEVFGFSSGRSITSSGTASYPEIGETNVRFRILSSSHPESSSVSRRSSARAAVRSSRASRFGSSAVITSRRSPLRSNTGAATAV